MSDSAGFFELPCSMSAAFRTAVSSNSLAPYIQDRQAASGLSSNSLLIMIKNFLTRSCLHR